MNSLMLSGRFTSNEWVNQQGEKSYLNDQRKRTISTPILRSALNILIINPSMTTNEFVGASACCFLEFDSQAPFSVAGAGQVWLHRMEHDVVTLQHWSDVERWNNIHQVFTRDCKQNQLYYILERAHWRKLFSHQITKGALSHLNMLYPDSIGILIYAINHQVACLLSAHCWCVFLHGMFYKSPYQQGVGGVLVSSSFGSCNSLSGYAVFGTLPLP